MVMAVSHSPQKPQADPKEQAMLDALKLLLKGVCPFYLSIQFPQLTANDWSAIFLALDLRKKLGPPKNPEGFCQ